MEKTGWSWSPMGKRWAIGAFLVIIFSYSILTILFIGQSDLSVPIWSKFQLVLSIVYFISGFIAFIIFIKENFRIIYGLLALFCILPSLHLYATSGVFTSIGAARYWYIYFAHISYYALFFLFANYLVDRLRTSEDRTPTESLASALYVTTGCVLGNYYYFFLDIHYLDKLDYTADTYYKPLYEADLRLSAGIFLALLVSVYWLYRILKAKKKNKEYVYAIIWIYAIVLAATEVFNISSGYRGANLKGNFSLIMLSYIMVNLFLFIFLLTHAIKGIFPKTESKGFLKELTMNKLKKKEMTWWQQAGHLAVNESFRNLIFFALLIFIIVLLIMAKLTANSFLFQTIAFFSGVFMFLYAVLFPFLIDITSNRKK